jgi:hypothetical protein
MAELDFDSGDKVNGEEKVQIEWLDFEFISSCNDYNKMLNIVSTLRSGKEGSYPDVSFNYFQTFSLYIILNINL